MKLRLQIALLSLVSCQSNLKIKGELIGSFSFSANPVSTDCTQTATPPVGPDGGFSFDGILSHDPSSQTAYLIVGSVERAATFDGQVFTSTASAPRHFMPCGCDPVYVNETLRVVLLSSSQDDALGHACPPDALDGGVPVAGPDGGISPPCPQSGGCSAVRACGDLIDTLVIADAGCNADCACSLLSQVEGQRKAVQP